MLERLWVLLVVLGYLGAGGLLFQLIEPPPPQTKQPITKYTENCLNQLWIITGTVQLHVALIIPVIAVLCCTQPSGLPQPPKTFSYHAPEPHGGYTMTRAYGQGFAHWKTS